MRRIYDAAQTPLERGLACAQAKKEQVAELKQLRQSLGPFQLGKLIDQKLERIYDLANRRLSPSDAGKPRCAGEGKNTTRQAHSRDGGGVSGYISNVFLKLGAQVVVSVRRIVLHLPKTSWSRPWSLFVLARWCEQNL